MSLMDHARAALETTKGYAISTAGGNSPRNSFGTLSGLVGIRCKGKSYDSYVLSLFG